MADDVLDADLGGLFLALLEELGHLAPVDLGKGGFALLDHAQSGDGEFEGDFEFRLGRGRGLARAFAGGGGRVGVTMTVDGGAMARCDWLAVVEGIQTRFSGW